MPVVDNAVCGFGLASDVSFALAQSTTFLLLCRMPTDSMMAEAGNDNKPTGA